MGPFLVSSHPLTACDSPTPWDSHETSNTKRIIQCNIGIFRPMSILYYRAVAKTPQNILLEGQWILEELFQLWPKKALISGTSYHYGMPLNLYV